MRIVRLQIERFRSIRSAIFFPERHNVYLGPNNLGKTAVLEALNLLLNPEIGGRGPVVDENDFYCREYRTPAPSATADPVGRASTDTTPPASLGAGQRAGPPDASNPASTDADADATVGTTATVTESLAADAVDVPVIRIEAVIAGLNDDDVDDGFSSVLVPWHPQQRVVVETSEEGADPFATAERAIRPCFEA